MRRWQRKKSLIYFNNATVYEAIAQQCGQWKQFKGKRRPDRFVSSQRRFLRIRFRKVIRITSPMKTGEQKRFFVCSGKKPILSHKFQLILFCLLDIFSNNFILHIICGHFVCYVWRIRYVLHYNRNNDSSVISLEFRCLHNIYGGK